MKIKISPDQILILKKSLLEAGTIEIGGQIFGEQLEPSNFLVSKLTIQKKKGTFSKFIVDLSQAIFDARNFFRLTRHQYTQFNYIGEWHSHPSFSVQPSHTDIETMKAIVTDATFSENFAVLMIAKLKDNNLIIGAWLFDPIGRTEIINLELL